MSGDQKLFLGSGQKTWRDPPPGKYGKVLLRVLALSGTISTGAVLLGSCLTRWRYREPCEMNLSTDAQALFDYMSFYSCSELPTALKSLLLLLWLALLISLLASTADDYFVPQLERLSCKLRLPEDVAGVTLLALGNGMPDVMTALSSVNKANDLALTMGEMLGAANFIVILVLAFVLLCKDGPTSVEAAPFIRDSLAYSAVAAYMVLVTWDGLINLYESLVFFVIYVVYASIVVLPGRLCRHRHQELETTLSRELELVDRNDMSPPAMLDDLQDFLPLGSESEAEEATSSGLAGLEIGRARRWAQVQLGAELPFTLARHVSIASADWDGRRRILAAVSPLGGLLLMFLSFGGWEAFQWSPDRFLRHAASAVVVIAAAVAIMVGSNPAKPPRWHVLLLIWAMVAAVSWFNLLANECVAVLETFGLNLGISSSVLGITVLAWGNSVGDLVADTALVKQGRSKMAVAGVFGSPILSDLLGLGLSLTSYTWSHGALPAKLTKQNRIAAVTLGISLLSTVSVFAASGFRCPRRFGLVLLAEYSLFMCMSVACELGLVPDVPSPVG